MEEKEEEKEEDPVSDSRGSRGNGNVVSFAVSSEDLVGMPLGEVACLEPVENLSVLGEGVNV